MCRLFFFRNKYLLYQQCNKKWFITVFCTWIIHRKHRTIRLALGWVIFWHFLLRAYKCNILMCRHAAKAFVRTIDWYTGYSASYNFSFLSSRYSTNIYMHIYIYIKLAYIKWALYYNNSTKYTHTIVILILLLNSLRFEFFLCAICIYDYPVSSYWHVKIFGKIYSL